MLVKYRHRCRISRKIRLENLEFVDVLVYSGECIFQDAKRSVISGEVVVTSPRLFLPANDADIEIGDAVTVYVEKGRTLVSEVNNLRDKSGDFIQGSRLELKECRVLSGSFNDDFNNDFDR